MKDRLFPYLTGVLLIGVALLAVLVVATRYHLPRDVARLSDVSTAVSGAVRKVEGPGPIAGCQAAITSGVLNSGGDKPSFGLPVIRSDGVAEDIYMHINSSVYSGWAECRVQKTVWQVLGNGPSTAPPKSNKPSS